MMQGHSFLSSSILRRCNVSGRWRKQSRKNVNQKGLHHRSFNSWFTWGCNLRTNLQWPKITTQFKCKIDNTGIDSMTIKIQHVQSSRVCLKILCKYLPKIKTSCCCFHCAVDVMPCWWFESVYVTTTVHIPVLERRIPLLQFSMWVNLFNRFRIISFFIVFLIS